MKTVIVLLFGLISVSANADCVSDTARSVGSNQAAKVCEFVGNECYELINSTWGAFQAAKSCRLVTDSCFNRNLATWRSAETAANVCQKEAEKSLN